MNDSQEEWKAREVERLSRLADDEEILRLLNEEVPPELEAKLNELIILMTLGINDNSESMKQRIEDKWIEYRAARMAHKPTKPRERMTVVDYARRIGKDRKTVIAMSKRGELGPVYSPENGTRGQYIYLDEIP